MSAQIINGKQIAAELNAETARLIKELEKTGKKTTLAVVLVGENPASQVYVRNKIKTCESLGIQSRPVYLSASSTTEEVLLAVKALNEDPEVDGILVQSPPPPQVDEERVILAIDPDKDVDCFSERNVGRLLIGKTSGFKPCTPWGVLELLHHCGISPNGKHAVIIGRSNIVGKPLAALLMQKSEFANATVTVVHSGTPNLEKFTREADILIAAIGRPEFVTGNMIKSGATVIDVGINRIADPVSGKNKLVGDVNFAEAEQVAGFITPVPGGVGPMTIAVLMRNAYTAARMRYDSKF